MCVEDVARLDITLELSGVTEDVVTEFFEIVQEAFDRDLLQSTDGEPTKGVSWLGYGCRLI